MAVKKKLGRPADPMRTMMRSQFAEWSDRTFDTWWSGFNMLASLVREGYLTHDEKVEIATEINQKIVRPNGTFSVARYERECADAYLKVVEAYDLEHDEAPDLPEGRGLVSGAESATEHPGGSS